MNFNIYRTVHGLQQPDFFGDSNFSSFYDCYNNSAMHKN